MISPSITFKLSRDGAEARWAGARGQTYLFASGSLHRAFLHPLGHLRLFRRDDNFHGFEQIMAEGAERFSMRIYGYCIMVNHWHPLAALFLCPWEIRTQRDQILFEIQNHNFF